jgi:hypothetical protein
MVIQEPLSLEPVVQQLQMTGKGYPFPVMGLDLIYKAGVKMFSLPGMGHIILPKALIIIIHQHLMVLQALHPL